MYFPVLCGPSLSATALSQTFFYPAFQLLAQTAYVCFHRRKWVHTRLSEKDRTQGLTRRNRGRFGRGRYYYPRSVPHVSETLRGRGLKRQTLPLSGLGRGHSQKTQRACGTAMHSCASLFRGVAAPLGCVIFSLLSKLRPVRPIPETSFSSPDAPACAVPVQAASQLAPFRLEADRGFSVLSLCLTSFSDFWKKKTADFVRTRHRSTV